MMDRAMADGVMDHVMMMTMADRVMDRMMRGSGLWCCHGYTCYGEQDDEQQEQFFHVIVFLRTN